MTQAKLFRRHAATVLSRAFTESMATREASRRVWTCDSKSEKKKIRTKNLEKRHQRSAGRLTCDLGVGIGKVTTDNNLVRLHPVEVTAGIGELVEGVADVALGTLAQGLEVGGELDGGVSAEMRSVGNLRCSIDRKGEYLTQGRDGAVEERRKIPRRRACWWPFVRAKEKRLGFLGLEEE